MDTHRMAATDSTAFRNPALCQDRIDCVLCAATDVRQGHHDTRPVPTIFSLTCETLNRPLLRLRRAVKGAPRRAFPVQVTASLYSIHPLLGSPSHPSHHDHEWLQLLVAHSHSVPDLIATVVL